MTMSEKSDTSQKESVPTASEKSVQGFTATFKGVEERQFKLDWTERDRWAWPAGEQGLKSCISDSSERLTRVLSHVPNKRRVIQAGGALGLFPARLSKEFDVVYTFEPNPILFTCLNLNCTSTNVFKYQAALDSKKGIGALNHYENHGDNQGAWFMMDLEQGAIPMMTLDSLYIPDVDLILLDCEGLEARILGGAVETVTRNHPVIVVEDKPALLERYGIEDNWYLKFCEDFGYKQVDQVGNDKVFVHE